MALELSPGQLRWRCDPETLGFRTTADIAPAALTVGQDRAASAIDLGLAIEADGYHVYVAGPIGTGRTTTVRRMVEAAAAKRPPAPDRCYLHNFRDPYRPVAVELPTGHGRELAKDLDDLVHAIREEIPRTFESEHYTDRRSAILRRMQERREQLLGELFAFAEAAEHSIEITPIGIVSAARDKGKDLTPEAFAALPEARRAQITENGEHLKRRIAETLAALRRVEREGHADVHELDREVAKFAIGHLVDGLRAKYAQHQAVLEHLAHVQEDVAEHLEDLRSPEPPSVPLASLIPAAPIYARYRANVVVDHFGETAAPVVFEPNPTYYNLVGRIDYEATFAAWRTDFSHVKAGALLRANGGYLVLRVRDVLTSPFAWDALKRSLREAEVRIETLGEQLSLVPAEALKPEPVPLRIRVVLIGDLFAFLVLYHLDDDFRKLFKLRADFAPHTARTDATVRGYAGFVSGRVREGRLPPFAADAVAAVLEHAARLAEHQARLTARFDVLEDLVVESAHWARSAGAAEVRAEHIERALAEQERRGSLLEDELRRLIVEGTIRIDTRSAAVGQVNALSVIEIADRPFAIPSRITARIGVGNEGVVGIEREVELSGRTHSKGVLVLGGYLLGTYAQVRPLAISARLTFEQTSSEVQGDSASAAELFALLSGLAGLPVRQGVAVTGAVDQSGIVQAVGAVTRKVEGHFDVCAALGLTGDQGVIVPRSNVPHLMLRRDVVDAVASGRFHVWAIDTVDEGIELLTGVPAGAAGPDGRYPADSVHGRVQARLEEMTRRLARFARSGALRSLSPGRSTGDGERVRA